MTYGEFIDLVLCYKIEKGVLREAVTDDEEMIPPDLE